MRRIPKGPPIVLPLYPIIIVVSMFFSFSLNPNPIPYIPHYRSFHFIFHYPVYPLCNPNVALMGTCYLKDGAQGPNCKVWGQQGTTCKVIGVVELTVLWGLGIAIPTKPVQA